MKVDALVAVMKARLDAVAKTAVDYVVDDAQMTVAKGGRMRVDTGFLRSSIAAALGTMPSGPSVRGADPMGDAGQVGLMVARWDVKTPLYIGWTANYAIYRESYDGFMEAALQNWPQHVGRAINEARGAFL